MQQLINKKPCNSFLLQGSDRGGGIGCRPAGV